MWWLLKKTKTNWGDTERGTDSVFGNKTWFGFLGSCRRSREDRTELLVVPDELWSHRQLKSYIYIQYHKLRQLSLYIVLFIPLTTWICTDESCHRTRAHVNKCEHHRTVMFTLVHVFRSWFLHQGADQASSACFKCRSASSSSSSSSSSSYIARCIKTSTGGEKWHKVRLRYINIHIRPWMKFTSNRDQMFQDVTG